MAKFVYVGRTADGKEKKGSVNADSTEAAVSAMRKKGLTPISVDEKPPFEIPFLSGGNVKVSDLVIFTRTFVTMLEAGLPIVQGLDILKAQQESKMFKKALEQVKESVEQGATLADSLRRHPKVFDTLYANLVEAGEAGGVLDTVLQRLAIFLEKQEKIRKEVKGAMTYPIISLCIAFGAVAIMLLKVIPTFETMFADFGRELPGLTVSVINLSHWMQESFVTIIISIVVTITTFKVVSQNEKVAWYLDALALRVPLIGNLIHKTALTRFNQTLGTLLASGVPIVDSLEICRGVVGNRLIAEHITMAIEGIREGKTFTEPLSESKYFPQMMIQMVEVGEQTGRLDQMLERVSLFYEEQVEAAVEAITSAIEPIMMVLIGGIVGTLLGAMYMPIFSIAGG